MSPADQVDARADDAATVRNPVPPPADSAAVRRRNLGAVLRHIAAHGPCARTEIAAATGLAHGSVTALVGDLIERGLVSEDDAQRGGGRGRPGRPLRLVPRRALSMAVQITSEQLRVVVADLGGAILWRESGPHRSESGRPDTMAAAVAAAVLRAAEGVAEPAGESDSAAVSSDSRAASTAGLRADGAGPADSELVRIVIAMAGPVRDDAAHTVVAAADFGWLEPVRLGELVGERLPGIGCPIDVVNDGNSAALAEYHARGRRGRLVLIEAGTGIGGGVVLNGRIEIGSHGVAGEPGHMPVALDGPVCLCGARGCLVLYAGPEAVVTAAGLGESLAREGVESASARLLDALAAGDARALAALETAGQALGAAILGITALLDVDEVVLGGLLARWFPWLEATIENRLTGRRSLARGVELGIGPAVLGEDAMLLGAIEFARRTVLSDPATVPLPNPAAGI